MGLFDLDRASAFLGKSRTWAASASVHLLALSVLLVASYRPRTISEPADPHTKGKLRWLRLGEPGGGGGGQEGDLPAASVLGERTERNEPRYAPLSPRKPRPLNFEDLEVPDLPQEAVLLLDGVFSPDGVEFPGPSLTDLRDWHGLNAAPSAGRGDGLGGGDGPGIGPGQGPGVGPGSGGGCCGGEGPGGGWDTDPVPIYKPPDPAYPALAQQRRITGEVILRVRVKLDGSTEVVGVVKSLPHCVDAAVESAKLWRWKPARRNGKPVEAFGIITVTFDLFAQA